MTSLTSLHRQRRLPETKLSLLTISHQAGSGLAANRALRLDIFAFKPSHEFGDRLHGFDRADALPASPDIAPSLRLRRTAAGGGEAHRLRVALRQAVRVKA